jgi:formate dehydrogenase major subunit
VEFVRTRPGEKGPNGRRSIESIQGSEFVLPADAVIAAVGQGAAPIPFAGETDKRGVIKADQTTFRTSLKNVYACGDYVTGPSTVIEAVSSGRKAAEQIARDVCGRDFREWAVRIEECNGTDRNRAWDFIPQVEMPKVEPASDRFQPAQREVELGFSPDAAEEETKRCYLCSLHYEIDVSRCIYCRYCIDNAPRDCIKLVEDLELNEIGAVVGYKETGNWRNVNAVVIDNSRCIRCGKCREVCPVDCISVSKVELVQRTASSGE